MEVKVMNYRKVIEEQIEILQDKQIEGKLTNSVQEVCLIAETIANLTERAMALPLMKSEPEQK